MAAKKTIPAQETIVPEQKLDVDVTQTVIDHAQRVVIAKLSVAAGVDRPAAIQTVVSGPEKFDRAVSEGLVGSNGKRANWLTWLNAEANLGLTITSST